MADLRAACRSCHAPIWWATVDNTGGLMPVDDKPTPDGNLAVRRDPNGDLYARVITDAAPLRDGERRGTSHFATCPNAGAHRRRGQR